EKCPLLIYVISNEADDLVAEQSEARRRRTRRLRLTDLCFDLKEFRTRSETSHCPGGLFGGPGLRLRIIGLVQPGELISCAEFGGGGLKGQGGRWRER